jgi:hypothetical protein
LLQPYFFGVAVFLVTFSETHDTAEVHAEHYFTQGNG